MPPSGRPRRPRGARARDAMSEGRPQGALSEPRGWGGVRCGAVADRGDSKGQSGGRSKRRKHRSGRSEREAQRAYWALPAGALEASVADPVSAFYKRSAWTLEVFAADRCPAVYKLVTEVYHYRFAIVFAERPSLYSRSIRTSKSTNKKRPRAGWCLRDRPSAKARSYSVSNSLVSSPTPSTPMVTESPSPSSTGGSR